MQYIDTLAENGFVPTNIKIYEQNAILSILFQNILMNSYS